MKRIVLTMAIACAGTAGALLATQGGPPPQGSFGRDRVALPGSPLVAALDLNRDGAISAGEIDRAPTSLLTLDVNHDGELVTEELRPLFARGGRGGERQEFGGRGGRESGQPAAGADDLADTLMAFDRDGNGKLERAEVPERFLGLFDRADANKDGLLTRDELKQAAASQASATPDGGRGGRGDGRGFGGGRGRGTGGDPILSAVDINSDGRLSSSEIAAARQALKAIDANQDGALSGDEIRPAFGRRGGGRPEGGRR